MILLRAVVLVVTAILAITGLVLAVVERQTRHGSLGSGPAISAWRSSTNRRDSARDANRCAAHQLPSAELARRNTSGLRSRAPAGRPSEVHSDGKTPNSRNLRPHSSNAGHAYGLGNRTGSSHAAASRVLSPRSALSAKMSTTAADCSSVRPASCCRTNSRRKIAGVTLEPGSCDGRSIGSPGSTAVMAVRST